jgi:hypothetical protein
MLSLKVCLIICFCWVNSLFAQPFVDPLNMRYTHAFEGANPNAPKVIASFFFAGAK